MTIDEAKMKQIIVPLLGRLLIFRWIPWYQTRLRVYFWHKDKRVSCLYPRSLDRQIALRKD
jgi:hypothetical protein